MKIGFTGKNQSNQFHGKYDQKSNYIMEKLFVLTEKINHQFHQKIKWKQEREMISRKNHGKLISRKNGSNQFHGKMCPKIKLTR